MIKEEKKKYIRPNIEVISVDRDISLIMMTGPEDPGGGDPRDASTNVSSTTTSSTATTSSSNFEQNPFGKK